MSKCVINDKGEEIKVGSFVVSEMSDVTTYGVVNKINKDVVRFSDLYTGTDWQLYCDQVRCATAEESLEALKELYRTIRASNKYEVLIDALSSAKSIKEQVETYKDVDEQVLKDIETLLGGIWVQIDEKTR